MTKHYRQIDAIKGIAIFMVTLGHAIIYYPVNLHENVYCEIVFQAVSSVHMPLFFAVSGFCFSFRGSYGGFILKKTRRLMVPYFVFNVLDMAARYLVPSAVNRPRGIGDSVVNTLLYGGEFWFLYTLFVIFLVFPAISRFIDKGGAREATALAASLALWFLSKYAPSVFQIGSACGYLFYFTAGYVLRRHMARITARVTRPIALGTALGVTWLALFTVKYAYDIPYIGLPTAVAGGGFIALLGNIKCARVFEGPGRYSLQIYLFNGFLLTFARTVTCTVLGVTNPLLIIAANMAVTYFLSYIIARYITSRFRITRFLTGQTDAKPGSGG